MRTADEILLSVLDVQHNLAMHKRDLQVVQDNIAKAEYQETALLIELKTRLGQQCGPVFALKDRCLYMAKYATSGPIITKLAMSPEQLRGLRDALGTI